MYLKLQTAPTEYPITLAEAKAQLRVEGSADDALISSLIGAVTEHVQNITNRQLMPATYRLFLDRLPSSVPLPRPPFAAITSIKAIDEIGQEVVFGDTYYKYIDTEYTTLRGVADSGWYASTYKDIVIEYTAGYENAAAVPGPIKQAMLLILSHLYTNREEVIVGTINSKNSFASDNLLAPYRIHNI